MADDTGAARLYARTMRSLSLAPGSRVALSARLSGKLGANALMTAVFLFVILAVSYKAQADVDMGWHIRTGAQIARSFPPPVVDTFTYSNGGAPWYYPAGNWIGQLMVYGAYRALGVAGLSWYVSIVFAIAAVIVYHSTRGPVSLRLLATLPIPVLANDILAPRPNVMSFLLAACVMWMLRRYRDTQDRRLWLLPVLFVIWANTHGGYPVGLALLWCQAAAVISAKLAERIGLFGRFALGGSALATHRVRFWVALALTCSIMQFVNPSGWHTVWYQYANVSTSVASGLIEEWQPLQLATPEGVTTFAYLFIALIAMKLTRQPAHITDLLWLIVFSVMAIATVRSTPFLALIAPAIVTRYARPLWRAAHIERHFRLGSAAGSFRQLAIWSVAICLSLLFLVWKVHWFETPRMEGMLRADFPVDAARFVRSAYSSGRVFNDYNHGGYLIWTLGEGFPVFVDSRFDQHGLPRVREWMRVQNASEGYLEVLERDAVDLVLVPSDTPLVGALSAQPGWTRVYTDSAAVVFHRR